MFNGFPGDKPRSGGGGSVSAERFPSSLQVKEIAGAVNIDSDTRNGMAAQVTALVTSATLTEVLNITGKGVISFAQLIPNGSTTANGCSVKITINGTIVLDETGLDVNNSKANAIIGVLNNNVGSGAEVQIPFNSLVIEIAGNGTTGCKLAYKRYLT